MSTNTEKTVGTFLIIEAVISILYALNQAVIAQTGRVLRIAAGIWLIRKR